MNIQVYNSIQKIKKYLINTKFLFCLKVLVTTIGITYVADVPNVSLYPLVILFIIGFIFSHKDIGTKDIYIQICAIILAIFWTLGRVDFICEKDVATAFGRLVVMLVGCYWFLEWLIYVFFEFYDKRCRIPKYANKQLRGSLVFFLTFISIACCWSIVWISEYPAVMTYDSINQAEQVLGISPLINNHPVAHTMWIRIWYKIVTFFGINIDITTAYGMISFIQMFLMDIIFSAETVFIYKRIRKWEVILFCIIFYGLISYNAFYSVTMWKDVSHGCITVIFLLILNKYFETEKTIVRKVISFLELFICGCVFALFRSNAYYALFIWIFCIIFYGIKMKDKLIISSIISAFICCTIIKGPVYNAIGVGEQNLTESLSIPLQQIAYVITNDNIYMTDDEYNFLNQVIDVDRIAKVYKDWISDPVKQLFNEKGNYEYFEEHKMDYLKLWVKLGIRDPIGYVTAWIKQTYGYWYPNVSYWVYWTGVRENDLGLIEKPLVSADFTSYIEQKAANYDEYPILGSLWNLGTFTWLVVIMAFYSLKQKKYGIVLNYILLLTIWLSLMLGTPVYAEFRYYYSIVASLPLILMMPMFLREENTMFS